MFVNFRLNEHKPQDDFYRIFKRTLILSFNKPKVRLRYSSNQVTYITANGAGPKLETTKRNKSYFRH